MGVLSALLYALRGPPELWLGAGPWMRIGRLGGIIAAGITAYFATLYLLGFRPGDGRSNCATHVGVAKALSLRILPSRTYVIL